MRRNQHRKDRCVNHPQVGCAIDGQCLRVNNTWVDSQCPSTHASTRGFSLTSELLWEHCRRAGGMVNARQVGGDIPIDTVVKQLTNIDIRQERASYSSQSASVGLEVLNAGRRGATIRDARGSVSVIVRTNFVPWSTICRSEHRAGILVKSRPGIAMTVHTDILVDILGIDCRRPQRVGAVDVLYFFISPSWSYHDTQGCLQ